MDVDQDNDHVTEQVHITNSNQSLEEQRYEVQYGYQKRNVSEPSVVVRTVSCTGSDDSGMLARSETGLTKKGNKTRDTKTSKRSNSHSTWKRLESGHKLTSEESAVSIEKAISEYITKRNLRDMRGRGSRNMSDKSLGTDPENDWVTNSSGESLCVLASTTPNLSEIPGCNSTPSSISSANIRAPNNSYSSFNESSNPSSAHVPPRISSRDLNERLSQKISVPRFSESETDSEEEITESEEEMVFGVDAKSNSASSFASQPRRQSISQFISIPKPDLSEVLKSSIRLEQLEGDIPQRSPSHSRTEVPMKSNLKSSSSFGKKVVQWNDVSKNQADFEQCKLADPGYFAQWKAARQENYNQLFLRFDRLHSIIESLVLIDKVKC